MQGAVEATSPWSIAASVLDPEVPVLTIEDLGILRAVEETGDGVVVTITPTYSGCPAMDAIRDDILTAFADGRPQRRARRVHVVARVDHGLDERRGEAQAARSSGSRRRTQG